MGIRVIGNLKAFSQFAPRWRRLLAASGTANPFVSVPWVEGCWACPENRQAVVVVEGDKPDGEPVAGFVFTCRWMMCRTNGLPARTLTLRPRIRAALPFAPAAVAVRRLSADEFDRVVARAMRHFGAWTVDLSHCAQLETIAPLSDWQEQGGYLAYPRQETPDVIVAIGSYDEYFRSRTTKIRWHVRNRYRRLKKAGLDWKVQRCSPATHSWPQVESMIVHISDKSWQRTSRVGPMHPEVVRHTLNLFGGMYAEDLLDAYVMSIDGQAAAFDIAVGRRDTRYVLIVGYDPKWREYEPGKLTHFAIMEQAEGGPFRQMNLGFMGSVSKTQYKQYWMTHTEPVRCLQCIRRSSPLGLADLLRREAPAVGALPRVLFGWLNGLRVRRAARSSSEPGGDQ
ncbi:MAG: hypothetical protein BIFFINMI_03530 [Phycisphaerae bacterium]|nr:hypothetical protein [Phycisphaerae bacterium]